MKTIISDKETICKNVVKSIGELLRDNPCANIAFSAADLDDEFFNALVRACQAGEIDFSNARIFSVSEFVSENILGANLSERFLGKTNVSVENLFLLNSSNFDTYDGLIESFGGLDLIVLGIGANCRLGFNEPGTPYSSLTHIQKLSEASIKQLQRFFPDGAKVPERAITLGIKSIANAKEITVMAFGDEVSDVLFKTLYARNDTATPSAFLQIPSDVSVYADREAAGKL